MRLFLTNDVRGPFSGQLYGRRGDEVQLVSDHGDMLIVQSNAVLWPVRRDGTTTAVAAPNACGQPPVEPTVAKHPAQRKHKKKTASITQTLF